MGEVRTARARSERFPAAFAGGSEPAPGGRGKRRRYSLALLSDAARLAVRDLLHRLSRGRRKGWSMTLTMGVLGLVAWLGWSPPAQGINTQKILDEIKPITLTGTIEAIDKATRTVTLKGPLGGTVDVKAPETMTGFDSLKIGDQVSATYYEAVAVQVRRPGEPAPPTDPMISTQRKDGTPGSMTRAQQTFTVSVEAVDVAAKKVTVKGPQGRVVTLHVPEAKQLDRLKIGDKVDVTYYESLLVSVKSGK